MERPLLSELRDGALRNSLMHTLATPSSDMILNRQNADTGKMVGCMASREENPVLVIPVDKLTEEHVKIPRPLFHTCKHHAIFAGHEQYKVNGQPMTIIDLKSLYKTKDGIMKHLRRVGQYETVTCAAYFVVNARNVGEAVCSVQDYASKNPETFFKCTPSDIHARYGGKKHSRTRKHKSKGKRKSQKRKFSKK